MDRAMQAYCQAQARKWLAASQKLKQTISYTSHRKQCMQEARGWLKASKAARTGSV